MSFKSAVLGFLRALTLLLHWLLQDSLTRRERKTPLNFLGFTYAIHLKLTPIVKHHFLKQSIHFYGDHVPKT